MLTIQTTINPETKSVFFNGEFLGEITDRNTFFEATHVNSTKAIFSSFEACKQLFEEVIKPNKITINNQLNLFN